MNKVLISRAQSKAGARAAGDAKGDGVRRPHLGDSTALSRGKKAAQRQGKRAAGDPLMMKVRAMISAATAVAARIVTNQ
jgi:hypothetical protein